MRRPLDHCSLLLLCAVLMSFVSSAQTEANAPDVALSVVAYVETRASAAEAARVALKRYREASRAQDARVELFEQSGRPGHFAVVETWRDQPSFDARDSSEHGQLLDALQTIRVSGYDQRLYKTLTRAPEVPSTEPGTVYVIAHVDVAPNPQVPVLLARLAEASRREAGNLRFDVVQHTTRANHFTVIERWRLSSATSSFARSSVPAGTSPPPRARSASR